jgi:hypothetical protein
MANSLRSAKIVRREDVKAADVVLVETVERVPPLTSRDPLS